MAEATGGVDRKFSFTHQIRPPDQRPSHFRVEDETAVGKRYSIGAELGRGNFGIVREMTNKVTSDKLAGKIVTKDKPGTTSVLMLYREVEVLKRLDHPHIIKLEEVLETNQKIFIVMELCTGGELTARLKAQGYFRELEAKEVMRQLTAVLVYLHDNDIVHRDLKLENVLLKSPVDLSSPEKINIKVTDFGLAYMKSLSDMEDPIMDEMCGTPYYMAPEVIHSRTEYTQKCDVWSLGVIMYYLICGKLPFQSEPGMKLTDVITLNEPTFNEVEWINISDKAQTLIKGMLCKDTTRRLTALRVLKDGWFTGESASKFMDAIQLMNDMTNRSEDSAERLLTQSTMPSVAQSLRHPLPKSSSHHPHNHPPDRKYRSTSTISPPSHPPHHVSPPSHPPHHVSPPSSSSSLASSSTLRSPSTGSLSRSPNRPRSMSIDARPATTTAHARKISQQHHPQHHHQHHHQQLHEHSPKHRKQNSHS